MYLCVLVDSLALHPLECESHNREPHLLFSSVALMLEKLGAWRCSPLVHILWGTGYKPAIWERDRKKVGKDKKKFCDRP